MLRTSGGLVFRWRGLDLYENGHGALAAEGGTQRLGLDGHVQMLYGLRVEITSAQRFGAGPPDGWLLDPLSGYVIAWRGMSGIDVRPGKRVAKLVLDGYQVVMMRPDSIFGPRDTDEGHPAAWLASRSPLERGEVMFDARRPRNPLRRVRRAKQAGAVNVGEGLLFFQRRVHGAWPPPLRDRSKHGLPESLPWFMSGHGGSR